MTDSADRRNEQGADAPEVWHVHYPEHDRELEEVVNGVVEVDQMESGETPPSRKLVLTRGDGFHPPGETAGDPFVFGTAKSRNKDEDVQTTIVDDEAVAVGYFLHTAEIHNLDREQMFSILRDNAPEWVATYEAWVDGLSVRDRRLRLMDLLEWRADKSDDWVAGIYLHEQPCTWRSTALSDEGEQVAREIEAEIDVHPSMCYRTAQMAALYAFDQPELADRVEYVEGVVLPDHASQAIKHAWIEIDGEVAELTWPWHEYDGGRAVYFGVAVDPETVREARYGRELGGPVFVDEDDLAEL